jgi:hypothetical protein
MVFFIVLQTDWPAQRLLEGAIAPSKKINWRRGGQFQRSRGGFCSPRTFSVRIPHAASGSAYRQEDEPGHVHIYQLNCPNWRPGSSNVEGRGNVWTRDRASVNLRLGVGYCLRQKALIGLDWILFSTSGVCSGLLPVHSLRTVNICSFQEVDLVRHCKCAIPEGQGGTI